MAIDHRIGASVADALKAIARDKTTDMSMDDVPEAVDAVVQRLEPTLSGLINAEPWYRSRVTWGAIIAGVGGLAGIAGYTLDAEDQRVLVDSAVATVGVISAAASVVGSLVAWWGRWRAKRPIGR